MSLMVGSDGPVSMGLIVWIAFWLLVTLLSLWLTAYCARRWSSRSGMDQLVRRAGSAENRDLVRAGAKMPAALCVLVWGIVLMVWTLIIDRIAQGWLDPRFGLPYSQLATGLVVGWLVFTAFGALLVVQTMTRNWPKFIVPPYLRYDPGYTEVRRARERGDDVDAMYASADAQWRSRQGHRK